MNSDPAPISNNYDLVPYPGAAFAQTQPDNLAVIARLFGLDPQFPSRAAILELGCADGGNLIPLAARYPNARFLGIDASAVEVAAGNAQIVSLGLENIRIEQRDITEFASPERFDYIIAHGVFSWVPGPVQQALLALCRDHLSDRGVAYVSYNVYPGWKSREVVRDAMLFHSAGAIDPKDKIQSARGFIKQLESIADANTSYGGLLRDENKLIGSAPNYYLFHDHLATINQPCYFHEFIAQARAHGLGFLGEAVIADMASPRVGAKVLESLQQLSGGDIIAAEQYLDFFRNRMFRQTLLVPESAIPRIARQIDTARLAGMQASAPIKVLTAATLNLPGQECEFQIGPVARIKTAKTNAKKLFAAIGSAYPRSVPIDQLCGDGDGDGDAQLNAMLLQLVLEGLLELHLEPVASGRATAPQPQAFAVARNLAGQRRDRVPNLRHESITLTPIEAQLLSLIDGQSSREQLLERLLDQSLSGQIRIERDRQPVTDEASLKPLLDGLLGSSLAKFERCALLA